MAPRSEDPKLIIRVINFELVQPICSAYINVRDGQTDGRTTYDSNTGLALRVSRGKNHVQHRAVEVAFTNLGFFRFLKNLKNPKVQILGF